MKREADIRWLAVGALAGLITAGYGILRQTPSASDLPEDVIASVNDTTIGRDAFERSLAKLGSPDTDELDRAYTLKRLVDEELLVQRGVELGMTESDSEVRSAIVNSLIASVTAEADAASPTDAELRQYLADNADRFSYTSRLSVEAWETEREALAQEFVAALRAGGRIEASGEIQAIPDLPAGLMPTEILRDYLGPAITAAVAEMPDGSSTVFARRGRWLVVRVVGKEADYLTDLDAIRNRVLLDYRRNLANEMLERYLENLRQRADIRVAAP